MSNRIRLFMQEALLLTGLLFCAAVNAQNSDEEDGTSALPASTMNKNYERLASVLPLYEQAAQHPWPIVPDGRVLKPGVHSSTVLILRTRLKATSDLPANTPDSSKFDHTLAEAIKTFQWRNGLTADGVVGAATLAALNISAEARTKQIRLNMERWQELSAHLGERYLLINIPEYRLHLIDNNKEVLTMKVVVGRPTRETPELTSQITRIVFNPHWNVPAMIAKNDIVPKVIEDPSYLNTNGIRIFNSDQENQYEISRSDVNWQDAKENGFPYHFRQDPGVKNALGRVKFEFVNSHDVYLHDTPAKELFKNDKRDFSSGCIRLEKPFALVDYLIRDDDRIDQEKISNTLLAAKTSYFRIMESLPIIITYATAWVDDTGTVHFAEDVYGHDNPTDGLVPPHETDSDAEN
jgi:murein L,D-transpeptidase YcbB/YkuD